MGGPTSSFFIIGRVCFTIHNKGLQLHIGGSTLSIDEPKKVLEELSEVMITSTLVFLCMAVCFITDALQIFVIAF